MIPRGVQARRNEHDQCDSRSDHALSTDIAELPFSGVLAHAYTNPCNHTLGYRHFNLGGRVRVHL
jgi:hypothetical protein